MDEKDIKIDILEGRFQEDHEKYKALSNKYYRLLSKVKKLENLEKQIKIKDASLWAIWALGCDYDGYSKAEDLKSLIDELVKYATYGRANDDKYVKDIMDNINL